MISSRPLDTGPIIAQAVVPVLAGDTEPTLGARILEQEHRPYPQAIHWIAQGRLSLEGRQVRLDGGHPVLPFAQANPTLE